MPQDQGIFSSPDQGTPDPKQQQNQTAGASADTTGPLAILVGEGRKYRSVEDLASAYMNIDSFAEKLKDENSTLHEREKVAPRISE